MKITPGKGVDRFHFGHTEAELVAALGPPDKQYRTDSEALRIQYFGLRIEFSIEPENENRLGWIEVYNTAATLFERAIIDEPVSNVLEFVGESLGEEPNREDFGSFETFFFPLNWVELQVQFGRIQCVNLGVIYDENDEPLWPNQTDDQILK